VIRGSCCFAHHVTSGLSKSHWEVFRCCPSSSCYSCGFGLANRNALHSLHRTHDINKAVVVAIIIRGRFILQVGELFVEDIHSSMLQYCIRVVHKTANVFNYRVGFLIDLMLGTRGHEKVD